MKWISFRGCSEINGPLSKSQSFLFTHLQMFPFIWLHFGWCLHGILSHEMKFHFCQNNRDEKTPAMNFISGCIMWTVIRNWPDTEMKIFISPKMKSHLNTLYFSLSYAEVKNSWKMLSPLGVKAQCWSKKLANFMQILPNLLKSWNYNATYKTSLRPFFTWKKEELGKGFLFNILTLDNKRRKGFLRR